MAVRAAADKRGDKMAVWWERAAITQLQLEAGENLVPPERFDPPAPRPITSTADVIALLRLTLELGEAEVRAPRKRSGPGLPARLLSQALALVDERIREARGLPPKPKRRDTAAINSPEKLINQLRVVGDA